MRTANNLIKAALGSNAIEGFDPAHVDQGQIAARVEHELDDLPNTVERLKSKLNLGHARSLDPLVEATMPSDFRPTNKLSDS